MSLERFEYRNTVTGDTRVELKGDEVHHPDHYAGHGVECKDAMASAMYGADVSNIGAYWWGCAFKYLFRFPRKGGRKDLEKAKQCIDFLIEEEYGK